MCILYETAIWWTLGTFRIYGKDRVWPWIMDGMYYGLILILTYGQDTQ
jgi:hypothetical protein